MGEGVGLRGVLDFEVKGVGCGLRKVGGVFILLFFVLIFLGEGGVYRSSGLGFF